MTNDELVSTFLSLMSKRQCHVCRDRRCQMLCMVFKAAAVSIVVAAAVFVAVKCPSQNNPAASVWDAPQARALFADVVEIHNTQIAYGNELLNEVRAVDRRVEALNKTGLDVLAVIASHGGYCNCCCGCGQRQGCGCCGTCRGCPSACGAPSGHPPSVMKKCPSCSK